MSVEIPPAMQAQADQLHQEAIVELRLFVGHVRKLLEGVNGNTPVTATLLTLIIQTWPVANVQAMCAIALTELARREAEL